MWQRVVEPVTRVHSKSNISSTAIYSKMREYQLQFTTSKIGERKKRSTLLNAIDRLRYSATRREYCHPHLVGAPHKRKSLFFIMSRICFGFFLLQTYTRIFLSSYGNGKEQQVTKAFYNCFANASFHRPNHHHPRILRVGFYFGHEKTQKRLPPTLDISYQLRYFRHKHQRHALF